MRRFLSFTLAAIMLCSVFVLTSCDPVEEVKKLVNDILGIPRYTITEDEWLSSFDVANYTATLEDDNYTIITALDYPYMKYEMAYHSESANPEVMYVDLRNGDMYYKSNGTWIKTNEDVLATDESSLTLKNDIKTHEINYSDLVYDKETKSYNYYDRMEADYSFKFEDGVLVCVEVQLKAGLNSKQVVTDIGTTVVELPDV